MRSPSLRQLRTVSAVAQHGSITAAAKRLGLTGPAISLQIQQLEEDAGLKLFERTRRGMVPTQAGETVLESARKVQAEMNSLEDALNALKGLSAGRIRLGVVSTGKYFAPRLIAGFLKEAPGVELKLFVGNRAEIVRKLKNYEIDIALMGRPPRDFDVRARLFGDHPLVFIAPADHPLVGVRNISKQRIAEEPLIVREVGSGTRVSLELFMSDIPGKLESLGTEMDSNETIKQAVIAGLGVAFISAHTIDHEVELGNLVVLDVEDTPIQRQWFSVSRAAATPTPAIAAFEDFLQTKGKEYLPRWSVLT